MIMIYKIISKKTGKFREGLTLEEALALTKMSREAFMTAQRNGHPKLTIIDQSPSTNRKDAREPKPKKQDIRLFWRKKRYAIPGALLIIFQLIVPISMAGRYTLMSPEERAAYDERKQLETTQYADARAQERKQKAAAKDARAAAKCWDEGEVLVKIAAETEMKAHLKSPRTAKFPWIDYHIADAGHCEYIFTSYVDSQNGFGATMRTDYIAHVKITGENKARTEILDAAQR